MIVAQVSTREDHPHIDVIDNLREPVRLGAGLDEHNNLSEQTQTQAILALQRFAQRLRAFAPHSVRAVATNAVRVARNGPAFIEKAQTALGFPIEVISGLEEARLVYCGVAHQRPVGEGPRLVVDIGGGSTEFIVGQDHTPLCLESLPIGCLSTAHAWFSDGHITTQAMHNAIAAARNTIRTLRPRLREAGWTHAVGSSGTARALAEICTHNGLTEHGISAQALSTIKAHVVNAGHLDAITLRGLKGDRLPMMPSGLALMCAVFEELHIQHMEVTDGALRQGLLYDMLCTKPD